MHHQHAFHFLVVLCCVLPFEFRCCCCCFPSTLLFLLDRFQPNTHIHCSTELLAHTKKSRGKKGGNGREENSQYGTQTQAYILRAVGMVRMSGDSILIYYFDFDCKCCSLLFFSLFTPADNKQTIYVMVDSALRVKYVVVQAASFMSSKRQRVRVELFFNAAFQCSSYMQMNTAYKFLRQCVCVSVYECVCPYKKICICATVLLIYDNRRKSHTF